MPLVVLQAATPQAVFRSVLPAQLALVVHSAVLTGGSRQAVRVMVWVQASSPPQHSLSLPLAPPPQAMLPVSWPSWIWRVREVAAVARVYVAARSSSQLSLTRSSVAPALLALQELATRSQPASRQHIQDQVSPLLQPRLTVTVLVGLPGVQVWVAVTQVVRLAQVREVAAGRAGRGGGRGQAGGGELGNGGSGCASWRPARQGPSGARRPSGAQGGSMPCKAGRLPGALPRLAG